MLVKFEVVIKTSGVQQLHMTSALPWSCSEIILILEYDYNFYICNHDHNYTTSIKKGTADLCSKAYFAVWEHELTMLDINL